VQARFIEKALSTSFYFLTGIIGLTAFLYPFLWPTISQIGDDPAGARGTLAPLVTVILLIICLIVLFLEIQGEAVSAKILAALGVLVAATSTLRFLEVAIPGPGGFSPIFAPIILASYVFGARFGFLMGTMTLVVSALLTGGIGPWLPYQMFAAGWVGLTAGWLPHFAKPRWTILLLIAFGVFWGLVYGLVMNIYFWPYMMGAADSMSWEAGLSLQQAGSRYLTFYITTSFIWDIARAAGNGLFVAILGIPTIAALTRFRDRFNFRVKGL